MAFSCLIQVLEEVFSLIKFNQLYDMFVCDFIITMKVCQGDIYALYFDLANNLTSFQFLTFNYFLEVNFFGLPMMRTMNLITKIENLTFEGNGQAIWAKHHN